MENQKFVEQMELFVANSIKSLIAMTPWIYSVNPSVNPRVNNKSKTVLGVQVIVRERLDHTEFDIIHTKRFNSFTKYEPLSLTHLSYVNDQHTDKSLLAFILGNNLMAKMNKLEAD